MKKVLPVAADVRQTAEDAFNAFVAGERTARRNVDTLKFLEFAALEIDALCLRYQSLLDAGEKYAAIVARQDVNSAAIDDALFAIQGVNGPFFDLRDYTTRLREIYRNLWLTENLSSWLPNVLQLYDQNSAEWQREIAAFERVKWEHREGKPLPSAQSLNLDFAGK